MIIKGRNAVKELLKTDTTISKILASNSSKDKAFSEIITLAKSKYIDVHFVDNKQLDKECENHQGVVAFTSEYNYFSIEDILQESEVRGEPHFILILDGVSDPHNFGSIIRVAECLGVHGIIIAKNRACPVTDTVVKVSAGATQHIKIARVTNINNDIEKLKKKNIWVYACELGGENLYTANLSGNIAIVMGSEGKGVSALTRKLCDGVVSIEMKGKVNSLNVSVATGIVLYETVRKRKI